MTSHGGAFHAGADVDDVLVSRRRVVPKAHYDVASACLATGASIAVLLAVFVVLLLV